MKLIIFVHTCYRYEESRAKKIENTWGAKENIVFITDNPNTTLKNNIYIGKYKQGPTYHPENVIKMFTLFIKKYNHYDWFMIIDDDSYLYIDRLMKFLEFHDKDDCLMIGDYLNWPSYHHELKEYSYNLWCSGGPGIVFTKKCIETFLILINNYKGNICNHDVWLHNIFLSVGKKLIKRIHCCGFHQYHTHVLSENELKKIPKNLLISIHLNRQLDLLSKFHNLNQS